VKNPIAGFAAMMEHFDDEVGKVLDLLDELGVDDNTLVMFASDNGAHKEGGHDPAFWNSTGSLRGHKRDMHEGGIRTPMLARWPAVIKAGRTTDHAGAFWDVLPTIAEMVGQPVPEQNTGISFLPTLRGESDKQKKHDYLYWEFTKGKGQKIFSRAVRKGKWKVYRQEGKKLELFNLERDPFEKNDVARSNPEIVSAFEKIIEEAHRELPK